ncbi:HlyU family transcriptional regulator [Loktanella sp. M215]|uniref:HlyU family transcriptional regulator n=1 Tax=Loktanella sp. M215 TaxID=2675431 RepID=UPI001F2D0244|nr:hypothetical protein [Loktanella sp. M215]
MAWLSKLFGSKPAADAPAQEGLSEDYNGFTITPNPMREGSTYRVAARITADVDGVAKVHQLIRADTMQDLDDARKASLNKARQMIDEQGKALFDS